MTVFEIECKAMTCRHNLFERCHKDENYETGVLEIDISGFCKHYESIFKEETE